MPHLSFVPSLFASASATGRISDWAVRIMEALGAPGAALLIAVENLFPPLPSELILPLAGFTASQGDMNLVSAILWTTIGSLAGAVILYYLGSWLGRERIRRFAQKLPLVKLTDVDKAENWFARYETQAVFFGRMIPVVRSLISIPAGIERMPMRTFLVYTAAGSAIWNSTLILAGYLLGEQWQLVERYVGIFQYVVVAALAVLVGKFVYDRLSKSRR